MSEKNILSFGMGATLRDGKFVACLIKFIFDDRETRLTAWARPQCGLILRMLMEHEHYLSSAGKIVNPATIERVIKDNEPSVTLEESEDLAVSAIVEGVEAKLRNNGYLIVTINRAKVDVPDVITLSPEHSAWLLAYITDTLEHFDEDGLPILAGSVSH